MAIVDHTYDSCTALHIMLKQSQLGSLWEYGLTQGKTPNYLLKENLFKSMAEKVLQIKITN